MRFSDDVDEHYEIVGTRTPFTPDSDEEVAYWAGSWGGEQVFRLGETAAYWEFRGQRPRDLQTFLMFPAAGPHHVKVLDTDYWNIRRLVDGGTAGAQRTVTDVAVHRYRGVGFSKGLIRASGDSTRWHVWNPEYAWWNRQSDPAAWFKAAPWMNDSRRQMDAFARLVEWQDACHAMLVENAFVKNCQMDKGTKYWQGDGAEDNSGCHHNVWRGIAARGNADGGMDCKGNDSVFEKIFGLDNKRNHRNWGDRVKITRLDSISPRLRGGSGGAAHVYTFGPSSIEINDIYAEGSGLVLHAENGGKLNIKSGDLSRCTGDLIREQSGGKVVIDSGVILPA
jgi:hypothetical protein